MVFPIKDTATLRLSKFLTVNGLYSGTTKEGNLQIRQLPSGLWQGRRMSRFAKNDKEPKLARFERIQRILNSTKAKLDTRESSFGSRPSEPQLARFERIQGIPNPAEVNPDTRESSFSSRPSESELARFERIHRMLNPAEVNPDTRESSFGSRPSESELARFERIHRMLNPRGVKPDTRESSFGSRPSEQQPARFERIQRMLNPAEVNPNTRESSLGSRPSEPQPPRFERIQRMLNSAEVKPGTQESSLGSRPSEVRESQLPPKLCLPQQAKDSPDIRKMKRYKHYQKMDYKLISPLYPTAPSRNVEFWYVIEAVALMGMGKQHLIAMLWLHLAEQYAEELKQTAKVGKGTKKKKEAEEGTDEGGPPTAEDLVWKAKRLREGILKCSILVGFPRAINAILGLYQIQALCPLDLNLTALQPPLRPELIQPPRSTSSNPSYECGLAFFRKLYTPEIAHRILDSMEASYCSADLRNFAISCIYGEILSKSSIISERETALLAMTSCLASAIINVDDIELGLDAQVKGHMYGARNLGATGQEIRGVVRLVSATHRALKGRVAKAENIFLQRHLRNEIKGYADWLPAEWGEDLQDVLKLASQWDVPAIIPGTPKNKPKGGNN